MSISDIEDQIQRAIQEGKFADLPGKGKPLRLEDDPHADPEWRLAYHLLRSSGYSLPWLELRQELETETAAALQALRRAWDWRVESLSQGKPAGQVEAEWKRASDAFRDQAAGLNKRIFDYNLKVPSDRFHMRKVDPQAEIERLAPS